MYVVMSDETPLVESFRGYAPRREFTLRVPMDPGPEKTRRITGNGYIRMVFGAKNGGAEDNIPAGDRFFTEANRYGTPKKTKYMNKSR